MAGNRFNPNKNDVNDLSRRRLRQLSRSASENLRLFGVSSNPEVFAPVQVHDCLLSDPIKPLTLEEVRGLKGKHVLKYALLTDGQLILAPSSRFNSLTMTSIRVLHPEVAGGNPVVCAGDVYTNNGQISNTGEWGKLAGVDNKTGHYLANGNSLKETIEHAFVRHGFEEAKGKVRTIKFNTQQPPKKLGTQLGVEVPHGPASSAKASLSGRSIIQRRQAGAALKSPSLLSQMEPREQLRMRDTIRVPYGETGLAGAKVYHGTVNSMVKSVTSGPQNIGKGFGGPGLYLALDGERHLAEEYAANAKQTSSNPKAKPVVLEGHINPDSYHRVGRIQIAKKDHKPDLKKGIFPSDWHTDKALCGFMKKHFDIIEVTGVADAGYEINSNRYLVVHASAGVDAVKWSLNGRVTLLKSAASLAGTNTKIGSVFGNATSAILSSRGSEKVRLWLAKDQPMRGKSWSGLYDGAKSIWHGFTGEFASEAMERTLLKAAVLNTTANPSKITTGNIAKWGGGSCFVGAMTGASLYAEHERNPEGRWIRDGLSRVAISSIAYAPIVGLAGGPASAVLMGIDMGHGRANADFDRAVENLCDLNQRNNKPVTLYDAELFIDQRRLDGAGMRYAIANITHAVVEPFHWLSGQAQDAMIPPPVTTFSDKKAGEVLANRGLTIQDFDAYTNRLYHQYLQDIASAISGEVEAQTPRATSTTSAAPATPPAISAAVPQSQASPTAGSIPSAEPDKSLPMGTPAGEIEVQAPRATSTISATPVTPPAASAAAPQPQASPTAGSSDSPPALEAKLIQLATVLNAMTRAGEKILDHQVQVNNTALRHKEVFAECKRVVERISTSRKLFHLNLHRELYTPHLVHNQAIHPNDRKKLAKEYRRTQAGLQELITQAEQSGKRIDKYNAKLEAMVDGLLYKLNNSSLNTTWGDVAVGLNVMMIAAAFNPAAGAFLGAASLLCNMFNADEVRRIQEKQQHLQSRINKASDTITTLEDIKRYHANKVEHQKQTSQQLAQNVLSTTGVSTNERIIEIIKQKKASEETVENRLKEISDLKKTEKKQQRALDKKTADLQDKYKKDLDKCDEKIKKYQGKLKAKLSDKERKKYEKKLKDERKDKREIKGKITEGTQEEVKALEITRSSLSDTKESLKTDKGDRRFWRDLDRDVSKVYKECYLALDAIDVATMHPDEKTEKLRSKMLDILCHYHQRRANLLSGINQTLQHFDGITANLTQLGLVGKRSQCLMQGVHGAAEVWAALDVLKLVTWQEAEIIEGRSKKNKDKGKSGKSKGKNKDNSSGENLITFMKISKKLYRRNKDKGFFQILGDLGGHLSKAWAKQGAACFLLTYVCSTLQLANGALTILSAISLLRETSAKDPMAEFMEHILQTMVNGIREHSKALDDIGFKCDEIFSVVKHIDASVAFLERTIIKRFDAQDEIADQRAVVAARDKRIEVINRYTEETDVAITRNEIGVLQTRLGAWRREIHGANLNGEDLVTFPRHMMLASNPKRYYGRIAQWPLLHTADRAVSHPYPDIDLYLNLVELFKKIWSKQAECNVEDLAVLSQNAAMLLQDGERIAEFISRLQNKAAFLDTYYQQYRSRLGLIKKTLDEATSCVDVQSASVGAEDVTQITTVCDETHFDRLDDQLKPGQRYSRDQTDSGKSLNCGNVDYRDIDRYFSQIVTIAQSELAKAHTAYVCQLAALCQLPHERHVWLSGQEGAVCRIKGIGKYTIWHSDEQVPYVCHQHGESAFVEVAKDLFSLVYLPHIAYVSACSTYSGFSDWLYTDYFFSRKFNKLPTTHPSVAIPSTDAFLPPLLYPEEHFSAATRIVLDDEHVKELLSFVSGNITCEYAFKKDPLLNNYELSLVYMFNRTNTATGNTRPYQIGTIKLISIAAVELDRIYPYSNQGSETHTVVLVFIITHLLPWIYQYQKNISKNEVADLALHVYSPRGHFAYSLVGTDKVREYMAPRLNIVEAMLATDAKYYYLENGREPVELEFELLDGFFALNSVINAEKKLQQKNIQQILSQSARYNNVLKELRSEYELLVATVRLITNLSLDQAQGLLAQHDIYSPDIFDYEMGYEPIKLRDFVNKIILKLGDAKLAELLRTRINNQPCQLMTDLCAELVLLAKYCSIAGVKVDRTVFADAAAKLSRFAPGTKGHEKAIASQPLASEAINTRGDGNCAFNACVIGIGQLCLSNDLPVHADFDRRLTEHLQLPTTNRSSIKEWFAAHDKNVWQMRIQVLLRIICVEYIQANKDIYYPLLLSELTSAFYAYKGRGESNSFLDFSEIKAQFDDSRTTEDTLTAWWNKVGLELYLNTLKEPARSAGDTKRWGSEVEIAALTWYFGITINMQDVQRIGTENGIILRLTEAQRNFLSSLSIGQSSFDRFILKFSNKNALALRMQPLRCSHEFTQLLNGDNEEVQLNQRLNNLITRAVLSAACIAELMERSIIKRNGKNYRFCAGNTGRIDLQTLRKRAQGVTDNALQETVLAAYQAKIIGFQVRRVGAHWEYIKLISHHPTDNLAAPGKAGIFGAANQQQNSPTNIPRAAM